MSRAELGLKRCIDLVASSLGLAALAVPFAVIAVAIRADSAGPVFFRQRRLGRGGRPFRIWKFRTMAVGASVIVDEAGNVVNAEQDARHTRMGRWLRRSSLDELPQLLNVLVGDMSLVGPRPDLPDAEALYAPDERIKLEVKPGITGLAQASGRNALTAHEKWALDARYAREATLGLDARIVFATLIAVVTRRGIYSPARRPEKVSRASEGASKGKS